MTRARLLHATLIAGHSAVAMLAVASFRIALPATPEVHRHNAGQLTYPIELTARRLPASRRAQRLIID